jgi:hypothetical protein
MRLIRKFEAARQHLLRLAVVAESSRGELGGLGLSCWRYANLGGGLLFLQVSHGRRNATVA